MSDISTMGADFKIDFVDYAQGTANFMFRAGCTMLAAACIALVLQWGGMLAGSIQAAVFAFALWYFHNDIAKRAATWVALLKAYEEYYNVSRPEVLRLLEEAKRAREA